MQTCRVAHAHGEASPRRPAFEVRVGLAAALLPFAVVTVVGLVVLRPDHRAPPVPFQFTTYGEGRTVFERGTVVGVSQQSCGGDGLATGIYALADRNVLALIEHAQQVAAPGRTTPPPAPASAPTGSSNPATSSQLPAIRPGGPSPLPSQRRTTTMSNDSNDSDSYDLVVVGSGGAAMSAAITACQANRTVLLVDSGTLGGTCVNVGCVPSKTLLRISGHRAAAAAKPFTGAPTSAGPVELDALVSGKDKLVEDLRRDKYAAVADAYGFEVRPGTAAFAGDGTFTVDGQPLPAGAYLLATGAEPAHPDLEGLDSVDYLTSTTAMEQSELPPRLIIIGGGYVGMEQAQLFAGLGTQVTVIGRLAPWAEPELRDVMAAGFQRDGIRVLQHRASSVEAHGPAGVSVTTDSGRRVAADRLLVAAGRTPRTIGLNLTAAGVRTDDRGFIVVDEQQRTTHPDVYAAGDVTGGPQYVYVAAAQGRVAATNALGSASTAATVDYTGLPAVMFTRPQLASAGLSEQQALDAGYDCNCRTLALADVPPPWSTPTP